MDDGMRTVICRDDPLYPESLNTVDSPPTKLNVLGDPEALGGALLLITGTRRATPYGMACSSMIAKVAAECGITVLSGGAMGCEAAALRAALSVGGRVVVWAGSGADVMYPRSSKDMFEAAASSTGCVVSEQPWGTLPSPHAFVQRRSLMAAIARSVVVTEAGTRSGTVALADTAIELGRKVYAVPGSIFSPESRGTNALISDGAVPIACIEDLRLNLLLDFPSSSTSLTKMSLHMEPNLDALGRALLASPMTVEQISSSRGISSVDVLRDLYARESANLIDRLPDGKWAPSSEYLQDRFSGQYPPSDMSEHQR